VHERRSLFRANHDWAPVSFAGRESDRKGDSALEAGRGGFAQLLERQTGGAVRLDGSPAALTTEEMFVEAPFLVRGELAGEEAYDWLLRARHG
jgi:hypothetical protein